MAAGGYPNSYQSGDVISGLENFNSPNMKVFHAGTKFNKNNEITTAGGRVLCVTALENNITQAQNAAYKGIKKISWNKSFYRSDIGYKAVDRENLK